MSIEGEWGIFSSLIPGRRNSAVQDQGRLVHGRLRKSLPCLLVQVSRTALSVQRSAQSCFSHSPTADAGLKALRELQPLKPGL